MSYNDYGMVPTAAPKREGMPRGKHYDNEATDYLLARRALVGLKKRRRAVESGKGFIDDSVPWNRNNEYGLQAITFSQAGGVNVSQLLGALRCDSVTNDMGGGPKGNTTLAPLGMRGTGGATSYLFKCQAPPRGRIKKIQLSALLTSVPVATLMDLYVYSRMSAADIVAMNAGVGSVMANEQEYICYWVTGISLAGVGATVQMVHEQKDVNAPFINETPLALDVTLPDNALYIRVMLDSLTARYNFSTKLWLEDFGELEIAGVG